MYEPNYPIETTEAGKENWMKYIPLHYNINALERLVNICRVSQRKI